MWEDGGQGPLTGLDGQFCIENRQFCLAFHLKVIVGILFSFYSVKNSVDGRLPFAVSEKTYLGHEWSVTPGRVTTFLLSHHLSLDHYVWRTWTFPSCFIPEKPLHTTKLFIEKNVPYLLAQVAWSLLSSCPVEVGTRCSWFDGKARGLLQPSLLSLSWKRSTGLLLYSEQTFGKLII